MGIGAPTGKPPRNLRETLYLSASTVDLPFPTNTSFLPRAGMPLVPGFSCPDGSNANRCGFLCPERSQKRLTLSFKVGIMVIRSTNPEDCVRELCARAAATDDPDELKKISSQLRAELNEQITNLGDLVVMDQSRAG